MIIGIGLANERGCWYLDLRDAEPEALEYLRQLLSRVQLTSFNVAFDGAWLQKFCGKWLNWAGCSYGLYKYNANEGFPEQTWGLESAQLNVLGWPTSNKTAFDELLVARGLTKAEVWRLPPEDIGAYCAGDADAAWQLWEELVAQTQPVLLKFHQREFMTLVRLLVEQQIDGMLADLQRLDEHTIDLAVQTEAAMQAFLTHPRVAPHVEFFNTQVRMQWALAEPPALTKPGKPSANHAKWQARDPEITWVGYFNPNSKPQLGWLLYERVFKVVRETKKVNVIEVDGKQYEIEKTPSGGRAVKKQSLPLFGEIGSMLVAYNKLVKEAGYVRAARELAEANGVLRPEYNSVGTCTGRPAGGATDDE